jgi:hypothetical protein
MGEHGWLVRSIGNRYVARARDAWPARQHGQQMTGRRDRRCQARTGGRQAVRADATAPHQTLPRVVCRANS